jgi:hypothetical protein
MNLFAGATYGFLFPYALLAAPLAGAVLVYAYLRRGRGTRVPVGTVLLLKALRRVSSSRKKFVPPLRFFFELALVGLLLAGAAGLFKEDPRRQAAVVIDNSFSMAARDADDLAGGTLLDAAGRMAADFVAELPDQARVEVFAAAPLLRSVSGGLAAKREALARIKEVSLAHAPDNLDAALARLAGSADYSQVVVFTDKPAVLADESGPGGRPSDDRFSVRSVLLPRARGSRQNVAISDMVLRRSRAPDRKGEIVVSVSSYALQQLEASLELEMVRSSSPLAGGTTVAQQKVALPPKASSDVVFNGLPQDGVAFAAKLRVNSPSAPNLDLIREDDAAWLSAESAAAGVHFVGELAPESLGLGQIRSLSFTQVPPEKYDALLAQKRFAAEDICVFHRVAPAVLPPCSALFILPPEQSTLFPRGAEAAEAQITRWLPSHPITTYLNLPSLGLKRFSALSVPGWGEEVVASTAGAAVVAGAQGQRRFAAVAFELLPYEGLRAPLPSVLLLNILSWLSAGGLNLGYQPVNAMLPVGADVTAARYMGGRELYRRRGSGESAAPLSLPESGLVLLERPGGASSLVAVNYFDAQESNLLSAQAVQVPLRRGGRAPALQKNMLARALALAVLALILAELLITSHIFGLRRRTAG